MSKEGSTEHIDKKGIALAIIMTALLAALFVSWMCVYITSTMKEAQEPTTNAIITTGIELPGYSKIAIGPVLEPVEVPAEPLAVKQATTTTTADIPAEQPAPTVSKWTNIMARAGITGPDQLIIDQLVFTGSDWNLANCGCERMVKATSNPITRFVLLDRYVTRTHGSWTAAQTQAAQGAW